MLLLAAAVAAATAATNDASSQSDSWNELPLDKTAEKHAELKTESSGEVDEEEYEEYYNEEGSGDDDDEDDDYLYDDDDDDDDENKKWYMTEEKEEEESATKKSNDDIHFAEHCIPPLTTIRQPRLQMGEMAMITLASMLENGTRVEHQVTLLDTELVVRKSTGRPPN